MNLTCPALIRSTRIKNRRWNIALIPALFATLTAGVLPAQTVTPEKEPEVITLSPFSVTSRVDRGYGSRSAMGASRIALPLLETSASIVTLNEALLKDTAMVDAR